MEGDKQNVVLAETGISSSDHIVWKRAGIRQMEVCSGRRLRDLSRRLHFFSSTDDGIDVGRSPDQK
jgi:hypothetical protein